jgi:DNA-directed RNA polymerase specialized sigma24 family protein
MWREARTQAGVPAPAPDPPVLEPEEVESLAAEAVTRAFKRFSRHGLHKWDPAGGLALTTWFYRDCLHQFANAVRAWSTDRRVLAPSLSCLLGLDEPNLAQLGHRPAFSASAAPDTEAAAISSVSLEARLRDIERVLDARTRRIAEEHFVNQRPLADVAREMGISRQSAHRLVIRCRKTMIEVWGEENQQ